MAKFDVWINNTAENSTAKLTNVTGDVLAVLTRAMDLGEYRGIEPEIKFLPAEVTYLYARGHVRTTEL